MERKELLLPNDVIMKILSKLPMTSVLRFHCVSKKWFNMLRDESFGNLHSDILLHSRSPSQSYPKLLFSRAQFGGPTGLKRQPIFTIKHPGSTYYSVIHGNEEDRALSNSYYLHDTIHCNGLLCMVGASGLLQWPIIVCNPLTLEYLAVPPCNSVHVDGSRVGFGFAPLSKQYKVICFEPPNILGAVKLYTLGGSTWRVVDLHEDFNPGIPCTNGLYVDGKIYWVMLGPQPNEHRLLSFDVESEHASVIGNLPPGVGDSRGCFKLAQLGSGVSLIVTRQGLEIVVWMLKDYSSIESNCPWRIRERTKLPDQFVVTRVQGICEIGEEDLLIVLESSPDRRLCYVRVSSTQRDNGQFFVAYSCNNRPIWYLCPGYKPSLIPLKRYGGSVGEILVDDGLDSPQNVQTP